MNKLANSKKYLRLSFFTIFLILILGNRAFSQYNVTIDPDLSVTTYTLDSAIVDFDFDIDINHLLCDTISYIQFDFRVRYQFLNEDNLWEYGFFDTIPGTVDFDGLDATITEKDTNLWKIVIPMSSENIDEIGCAVSDYTNFNLESVARIVTGNSIIDPRINAYGCKRWTGRVVRAKYVTLNNFTIDIPNKFVQIPSGICPEDAGSGNLNRTSNYTTEGEILTEEIIISPNPSSGKFLVNVPMDTSTKFQLLNLEGRVIKATSNNIFDVSYLSNGIYYLKVIQEDKVQTCKVVISN